MIIPNTAIASLDKVVELNTTKESPIGNVTITVIFTSMGHRCGYISIPKDNKNIANLVDSCKANFHGGISFSKTFDGITTLGFDCAHCGDKKDLDTLDRYVLEGKLDIEKSLYDSYIESNLINSDSIARTALYVKDCCIATLKEVTL